MFELQVGIQLTRLSELQGKAQSHRVGHTLVDFFAVRTKGTRSLGQKAKHLSEEDDPILKKVLKESLREETNRKTRLLVVIFEVFSMPFVTFGIFRRRNLPEMELCCSHFSSGT